MFETYTHSLQAVGDHLQYYHHWHLPQRPAKHWQDAKGEKSVLVAMLVLG
jgi:hypothetical protein